MRTALIAALAAGSLLGPAMAADMPVKAPIDYFTWTGFYAGGNVGWASGHANWCTDATITTCIGGPIDVVNQNMNGIVGGGQAGLRWQWGAAVLGLEAMFDGLGLETTSPSCLSLVPPCGGVLFPGRTRTSQFSNIFSATASVGYAWNKSLAYIKGGVAGASVEFSANNTTAGGVNLNDAFVAPGWTVGVGLEYAVTNWVSLGVEYDFYGFSLANQTNIFNTGAVLIPCAFCNFNNVNVQTVTARINFRLGDWFFLPYSRPTAQ